MKSKQYRKLAMEDGRLARFAWGAFKEYVDQRAEEYDRAAGKSRGGRQRVFRELADCALHESFDTAEGKIKNWYHGNNGPSDLEIIYEMERYFRAEKGDLLEIMEDQSKMNVFETAAESCTLLPCGETVRRMGNAAFEEKARTEINRLYNALQDGIHAYYHVWLDIWQNGQDHNLLDRMGIAAGCTEELKQAAKNFPQEKEYEHLIRKSAMYVPERIRREAIRLIEEMFGAPPACVGELWPCDIGWLEGEKFDCYVSRHEIGSEELEDDAEWNREVCSFFCEQTDEYYDRLDEIFEDYLV